MTERAAAALTWIRAGMPKPPPREDIISRLSAAEMNTVCHSIRGERLSLS